MVGTAEDFMIFVDSLGAGGAPILARETARLASSNRVGSLCIDEAPGWGFGHLSGVLINPEHAGSPASIGTLSWGGVYGHSWFYDPVADLGVVALTNIAGEGCSGSFPTDVQAAVYGFRDAAARFSDRTGHQPPENL
jgi:CubicO group peptidase (beta-lactamase class C family)